MKLTALILAIASAAPGRAIQQHRSGVTADRLMVESVTVHSTLDASGRYTVSVVAHHARLDEVRQEWSRGNGPPSEEHKDLVARWATGPVATLSCCTAAERDAVERVVLGTKREAA